MYSPVETTELLAFAKSVEARSLSRAALDLGIPRATLSRRLARLEERLATRLLKRTTRSLVLTDAGETLYRHARIALEAVARAEASVHRSDDEIRGVLRVSVPPIFTASFQAFVTGFAEAHPDLQLHVHLSGELVDLRSGQFDVAIRASTDHQPGLIARTLARDSIIAVASPGYLKASGTPRTARHLRSHRLLLGFARGEVPQTHWPLVGGGKVQTTGVFFCNDPLLLGAAASSGLGIALVPSHIASPLIARGELVHVLENVVGAEVRIAVVYAEREFLPAAVRAFVDAVVAWGTAELMPQAAASKAHRRSGPPRRPIAKLKAKANTK